MTDSQDALLRIVYQREKERFEQALDIVRKERVDQSMDAGNSAFGSGYFKMSFATFTAWKTRLEKDHEVMQKQFRSILQ
jgi:hypothetical protein